jgi:hypothetical protein
MSTTQDTTPTPAGSVERPVGQCCEHCDDGDGFSVYPYYGVAPHIHDTTGRETAGDPLALIGSTRLLPPDQWGDNFREDPECPGLGVYLRCEHCGRGELPNK